MRKARSEWPAWVYQVPVYGIGAQVSYWATPRLNLSLKYMDEYDAEARFEGEWVMFNITYLPFNLF